MLNVSFGATKVAQGQRNLGGEQQIHHRSVNIG